MTMAPTLFYTVRDGALEAVDKTLYHAKLDLAGAMLRSINTDHQTLLFYAVQRKEHALKVCRLLIERYQVPASHVDSRGQTALHWLATTGNVACVDLLVEKRCNIDHVDSLLHQTPLFYAAHRGTIGMVRRLLDLRANAGFKDKQGKIPLCWAASMETAKELAAHCSSNALQCCSKQAVASALDWHKQGGRSACSRYLATCAEAWAVQGRVCWVVRDDAGQHPAYVTSLARRRDVPKLCALEDEFIEDHREILGDGISDQELFKQIGLNPSASVRRDTIRHIAGAGPQSGKVRHYTLSCHCLPHNPKELNGGARARTYQVVGYVYFKICGGARDMEEEELADDHKPRMDSSPNVGHLVISHVKVSRYHQNRGVATLLLASALQFAENEREGFECRSLHLSAAGRNLAASALYSKLGFVIAKSGGEHQGWLSMWRTVPDSSLSELRRQWLQLAWGHHSKSARGKSPVIPVIQVSPQVSPVIQEASSSSLSEEEIKPPSRKRKLSSSASNASDTSTSAGPSSVVSSVSSASVDTHSVVNSD